MRQGGEGENGEEREDGKRFCKGGTKKGVKGAEKIKGKMSGEGWTRSEIGKGEVDKWRGRKRNMLSTRAEHHFQTILVQLQLSWATFVGPHTPLSTEGSVTSCHLPIESARGL